MLPSAIPRLAPLAAFVLVMAACNGAGTPPATDATTPVAETTPSAEPAPAPSTGTPPPAEPVPPPASEPPASDQLARFDGYGDMRFGMSAQDARKAWDGELGGPTSGSHCYYVNPVSNPEQAYFALMMDGGKFVRYDVGNDREVAPGGGKRGMTQARIAELYGDRVEVTPHKYSDGKYLRIKDTAGNGVLVFETDGAGKVTEWHVGVPPQVDYVEGCS
ncbi:lectin [Agrilutibacter solisilvae]|uniref:Lectin n=1 Tax=Agrilutibacter solisilvae TaxID=2763317 RepID=A0A974Y1A0_9GAMM|nr:lectin [Lysobacter solisilvae]QSX79596.1 lectin [Lysobacter solisilvae]